MVKEMFNNIKTIKSILFPLWKRGIKGDLRSGAEYKNLFRLLNSKRGLSLIAVLWMVTILTVLASEFMYSLQLEVKTSRNWNDSVNAYYSAKGGFETAIANLNADETSYDSLDEDWAQGFIGELNNSSFEAKLIDESARINVNTADEATLTKVIEYCLTSQNTGNDKAESEITAEAQKLASAVVATRPYRTIAEVAKAEGMTPELLYGYTSESSDENTNTSSTNADEAQKAIPLLDVTTVFSLDKNVSNDGKKRININSADANQIQQGVNVQGQQQQVITQQEAQAIVDYRSQSNNNQGGGGGGQTAQNTPGGQTDQSGQTTTSGQNPQATNQTYKIITDLLNVPAISQQTLDSIRTKIDIQDSQQGGQQGGQNQPQKININSASADQLRSLSDRIDDGIANSIINYRQNNTFSNVDGLLQVKAISIQDIKTIADKVTTTDDATLAGKININTAPLEILKMLPGMDEQKANAIIAYRQTGTTLASGTTGTQTSNQVQMGQQQGGPLDNAGKLLDIQGVDENTFRQLVDIITYRTYTFRIESTGKSQDEKIVSGFTAIIDRSGDSVKIKYWKQY
jgi:DNA uptake protein ComE-like DNA-binding protein